MSLKITLILTLTTLAACAFFGWRGMRPADPARGPRLIPHHFLMLITAAVLLFLLAHLAGLAVAGAG